MTARLAVIGGTAFPHLPRNRSLHGYPCLPIHGGDVQPLTNRAVSRRAVLAGTGAAVAGVAAVSPGRAEAAEDAVPGLSLRYDEPAADWESQALPIGNGTL